MSIDGLLFSQGGVVLNLTKLLDTISGNPSPLKSVKYPSVSVLVVLVLLAVPTPKGPKPIFASNPSVLVLDLDSSSSVIEEISFSVPNPFCIPKFGRYFKLLPFLYTLSGKPSPLISIKLILVFSLLWL